MHVKESYMYEKSREYIHVHSLLYLNIHDRDSCWLKLG